MIVFNYLRRRESEERWWEGRIEGRKRKDEFKNAKEKIDDKQQRNVAVSAEKHVT